MSNVEFLAGAPNPGALQPWLNADQILLDAIPAGIHVCSVDRVIIRHNRRAEELWGRAPERGESDDSYSGAFRLYDLKGQLLPHAETPLQKVLRTGQPLEDQELAVERPDGKRTILLVNIAPFRDRVGRVQGAVVTAQEITARKQAEEAFAEAQEFLRALVATTPECIKVVAPDARVLQMNPAGLRMVGAENAYQVEGASVLDLVAPEHREVWRQMHDRVCAGERLSWTFDIIALDGTRHHMETHAVPLRVPGGTVCQLAVTRDETERQRQQRKLEEAEQHWRDLLESLPAAVYTTDAEGRITYFNRACVEFSGREPKLGEMWCVTWRLHWPDGRPLPHDECPMAIALDEGRPVRGYEAVAERPDGSRVAFIPFPTPFFDADGRLAGAVNMLVDISERKESEHRLRALIDELNHRVRNTLAQVQAIAAQTARKAPTILSFSKAFEGRLMALSRAHDLLTATLWAGAGLKDVLSQALAPYALSNTVRLSMSGEDVMLPPRQALPLSMVFHELATNAAKYGALSVPDGRVQVEWRIDSTSGHARMLHLEWRETDGPAVTPPRSFGFGAKLIDRTIAGELQGETDLRYEPAGLCCSLQIPLV
jgi:PAS domain S-box-containing protein